MTYYQGNLALKQEPTTYKQTRKTTRTVQTTKTLPKKEKMLYLLSLGVVGVVAFLVILNGALVYSTNLELQQSKQAIKELTQKNAILQVEIRSLHEPKRLQEMSGQNASVAVNVR
jgi:cell division protein FtsL